MATGLLALLDDVAALVKASAASLDDIPAQVAKTSGKVSGVVIDNAAVTPKYVVGLDPKGELAIIATIARQSLINKVLFLSPFILLLDWMAPWALSPLLMVGGGYLCFEGYEKVHDLFTKHSAHEMSESVQSITPEALEQVRIKSAVTTDFILSAEIVAITYAAIAEQPFLTQIVVLLSVALLITAAVYGFVGLIVKADDIGLHLATHHTHPRIQTFGKSLISMMPGFLKVLGYIGTAAMLWVGAEIIIHGIPVAHHWLETLQHRFTPPFLSWAAKVLLCIFLGLLLGYLIEMIIHWGRKMIRMPSH